MAGPPTPSSRTGMGTILYPGGAAFRVWAPFAPAVFVAGTFNQWSATANPFASEGNGYWSVEVPGAGVGDEYQFVIPDGGNGIWHKNPYASEVVNSSGNAIIHDPNFDWTGDDFVMPPWNELVIYEMHVGTFVDVAGCGPGTFETVIPKLAYLADLGINAIEIMPVAEFPMSLSWGYNPAQPFSVETAIGGPRGLHEFVKAAHAHGIGVLLDVVYNHFGPGDLDLWRFDGWSSSDHNGGIYFYDNARAHTPWGDTRPDYGRPEVRQYIRDNALFWLDKYRLDGLRFDQVINIRNRNGNNNDPANDIADGWSLLQWINDEIRGAAALEDHDRRGPAEQRLDHPRHGRGRRRLRLAMGRGIRPSDPRRDHHRQRRRPRHGIRERGASFTATTATRSARVIYTESHDEVANGHAGAGGDLAGQRRQLVLAQALDAGAAMVFTAPGIPMIFQGQEFLEDSTFRTASRSTGRSARPTPASTLLYRDLIRLRRNWFNQTRGLRGQHSTSITSTTPTRCSPFTAGTMAARATMWSWWRTSPIAATTATRWVFRARAVARAFQQRLARLQRGLRQPAWLRHGRGRPSDGQHAVPSHGRHRPVHCSCPVPGPLRIYFNLSGRKRGTGGGCRRGCAAASLR